MSKLINLNQDKSRKTSFLILGIGLVILSSVLISEPMISAQTESEEIIEATDESTILNIKKVIQDKQVELGNSDQQTVQLKQAYLAQVNRVSAETLTITNNQVNSIIPLTDDLEIMKDEELLEIDEIAVDDWVIVYSILEEGVPTVKRVLVTDKNFSQNERKIVLGTITELNANNLLFDSRTGENDLIFLLDKETQYFDVNGNEIGLNKFYVELQCLIVAVINSNDQWRVSSIKTLVDSAN